MRTLLTLVVFCWAVLVGAMAVVAKDQALLYAALIVIAVSVPYGFVLVTRQPKRQIRVIKRADFAGQ